jgi:hypothetical protein
MGRPPIGARAMTSAESQHRYLAKLRGQAAGPPPPPAPPLIEVVATVLTKATAERSAFEQWFEAHSRPTARSKFVLDGEGDYKLDVVQAAWEAWRARGGRALVKEAKGLGRSR